MAKKFFYNRVYNTKRTIINLVIIGICIIGVIACFIITSNFEGENHNTPESSLSIKNEITIEINEELSKEMFFSKIENVNLEEIEIVYPENFNSSIPGKYKITIKIDRKDYITNLIVVDTTKPILALKTVTIAAKKSYKVSDFVESCTDNSNNKCSLTFYADGVDEDGNVIDYSKYTDEGTYSIKISAKDNSGNQTVKETKLVIKNSQANNKPNKEPVKANCKYGSNTYDKDKYLIALDVSTNGCAVNLDTFNDIKNNEAFNKLKEAEAIRIKKDINKLNLPGTLSLNMVALAVTNNDDSDDVSGIVGYQLRITISMTHNNKTQTVVDYKVDSDGKRVFISNPYNISK